jgi:pimeloyl-ACP methyl ester carboxylesterase
MIQDLSGNIDYDECGDGPTIVMVPGSCSTGAVWKPVIAALGGRFRCVTTSLLGYAIETTPVNILDWASAYGFPLSALTLASIDIPTLFCWGNQSQPAVQRANELLSDSIEKSKQSTVHGAAHFMIATHAKEVAQLIASHVAVAERNRGFKVLDRA